MGTPLPARLEGIGLHEIQALQTAGVPEGTRLDYKVSTVGSRPSDADDFVHDVVSFATAEGGDIVFGVTERGGVPVAIDGLENIDADKEITRLNLLIQSLAEPRINVRFH